jgi:5-(carboxyamino)imidazole ribonucleotide synthase
MTAALRAPVEPGQAIGILGGGQLARMLSLAAARLGLRTIILAPQAEPPAAEVSWHHIRADYSDGQAIAELCASAALVTHEWENVSLAAARAIAERVPFEPKPLALATKQDRLHEKKFLTGLGIEVAPYADVSSTDDLSRAARIGFPAVLKTRRLGYDGKGQSKVGSIDDLWGAWDDHARVPCCLERFMAFDGEASIIAARCHDGAFAAYDLTENEHTADHILKTSRVPARWNGDLTGRAQGIAHQIAEALDYVGVLGVELFIVGDKLLVNEIAPRVHNSGHWTIDAAETSQFEQHVRAICGWPLGSTIRHSDAVMTNLIGDDIKTWSELAAQPGAHLHLYGKREIRPGRKMGHITHTYRGRPPG